MISKVRLENFKCFEKFSMDLKNVTVLTGINGMGKSTVMQALLLLHQSWLSDPDIGRLYIKGKYADLGTGIDILSVSYTHLSIQALIQQGVYKEKLF